jgi:hypothetical protein
MATAAQETRVFSTEEAERFAALMAGFEIANPSEAEAMGKGRLLRRMAVEKQVRLVDAWEMPEIRAALDAQLQPVRQALLTVLETENEDLRSKLGLVVPKVTELAEALDALTRVREEEARSMEEYLAWFFGVATAFDAAFAVCGIAQRDGWLVVIGCAGLILGLWFLKSEI